MKLKTARPSPDSSVSMFEREHVRPKAGRTLIVGSRQYVDKEDRRARHADALGVDMLEGPGVDRVVDLEGELPDDLGLFDHVECMSVLEHARMPWLMASNIERLMRPGASIFVTVPFCWRVHSYPSDLWRMTPEAVKVIFPGVTWDALLLASDELTPGPKIKTIKVDDYPYFIRTETVGFGHK